MSRNEDNKISTVIEKNTFYFFNQEFENTYESYIHSIKEILINIKNEIDNEGLKEEIFESLLKKKEYGLKAILSLNGFSNEYLKRIITIARIVNDKELNELINKEKWCDKEETDNIREWSDSKIQSLIKGNRYFRKGIVNLFFKGSTVPFLVKNIPPFELKKLSLSKLKFEVSEMIDTLIRYKEKGSYSGKKENNPETVIKSVLDNHNIPFESGDLNELIENAQNRKRTMDFIIPNKKEPLIIIESSFLATTSSGQGDKSKTEIEINKLLKKHYPKATFIGFIDGIGWYVRKEDLKRMVSAYEDVFTFHREEIKRFESLLLKKFKKSP